MPRNADSRSIFRVSIPMSIPFYKYYFLMVGHISTKNDLFVHLMLILFARSLLKIERLQKIFQMIFFSHSSRKSSRNSSCWILDFYWNTRDSCKKYARDASTNSPQNSFSDYIKNPR